LVLGLGAGAGVGSLVGVLVGLGAWRQSTHTSDSGHRTHTSLTTDKNDPRSLDAGRVDLPSAAVSCDADVASDMATASDAAWIGREGGTPDKEGGSLGRGVQCIEVPRFQETPAQPLFTPQATGNSPADTESDHMPFLPSHSRSPSPRAPPLAPRLSPIPLSPPDSLSRSLCLSNYPTLPPPHVLSQHTLLPQHPIHTLPGSALPLVRRPAAPGALATQGPRRTN